MSRIAKYALALKKKSEKELSRGEELQRICGPDMVVIKDRLEVPHNTAGIADVANADDLDRAKSGVAWLLKVRQASSIRQVEAIFSDVPAGRYLVEWKYMVLPGCNITHASLAIENVLVTQVKRFVRKAAIKANTVVNKPQRFDLRGTCAFCQKSTQLNDVGNCHKCDEKHGKPAGVERLVAPIAPEWQTTLLGPFFFAEHQQRVKTWICFPSAVDGNIAMLFHTAVLRTHVASEQFRKIQNELEHTDLPHSLSWIVTEYLNVDRLGRDTDWSSQEPPPMENFGLHLMEGLVVASSERSIGLDKGDFIVAIDGERVRGKSDWQAQMKRRTPGDLCKVEYWSVSMDHQGKTSLEKKVKQVMLGVKGARLAPMFSLVRQRNKLLLQKAFPLPRAQLTLRHTNGQFWYRISDIDFPRTMMPRASDTPANKVSLYVKVSRQGTRKSGWSKPLKFNEVDMEKYVEFNDGDKLTHTRWWTDGQHPEQVSSVDFGKSHKVSRGALKFQELVVEVNCEAGQVFSLCLPLCDLGQNQYNSFGLYYLLPSNHAIMPSAADPMCLDEAPPPEYESLSTDELSLEGQGGQGVHWTITPSKLKALGLQDNHKHVLQKREMQIPLHKLPSVQEKLQKYQKLAAALSVVFFDRLGLLVRSSSASYARYGEMQMGDIVVAAASDQEDLHDQCVRAMKFKRGPGLQLTKTMLEDTIRALYQDNTVANHRDVLMRLAYFRPLSVPHGQHDPNLIFSSIRLREGEQVSKSKYR